MFCVTQYIARRETVFTSNCFVSNTTLIRLRVGSTRVRWMPWRRRKGTRHQTGSANILVFVSIVGNEGISHDKRRQSEHATMNPNYPQRIWAEFVRKHTRECWTLNVTLWFTAGKMLICQIFHCPIQSLANKALRGKVKRAVVHHINLYGSTRTFKHTWMCHDKAFWIERVRKGSQSNFATGMSLEECNRTRSLITGGEATVHQSFSVLPSRHSLYTSGSKSFICPSATLVER